MRLYEVWTPKGAIAGYGDKSLADKAFRRASSPALLTLGASVLAVREGTTQRQRDAIEGLLKAARSGGETIDVPKPDPAAAKVHRLPLVARRPVEVEADETDDDTTDAGDELDAAGCDDTDDTDDSDDTADEELPTADAPRDPSPAVERPVVVAAPAPTKPEVSMAPKSTEQAARPTCAAKGCTNPVPPRQPAGRRTVEWRGPYCHRCRDRGRHAINRGQVTAETVGAYLDGRDHRDTTEATKARMVQRAAAKKVVKVPRVAAVTAPEQAVELSADTIQVTIALPPDVARAHRCALAVGGVEALERLIAALPAAVRS